MVVWKKLSALKIPFNDAMNYNSKVNKDLFNKLFLRTAEVQNLIQPNIYYLVGKKGVRDNFRDVSSWLPALAILIRDFAQP